MSKASLLAFTLSFLTFLCSCSSTDLRPDFSAEKKILQREWSYRARNRQTLAGERGVEFSNPVLWENALLFGSSEVGLVAVYPTLGGQLRWSLPIRGGVISELRLQGNIVYFGGGDGFFYAVNAETGRVLWRFDVRNPKISKPTLHQGHVFFTSSEDSFYCLEASTGRLIWQYKRKNGGLTSIHAASEPAIDGNQVLAGSSDGYLIALSLKEGRLIQEKKLTSAIKFTDVDASVVQDGQSLFIPSYDGNLYALTRGSLETRWKFEAGGTRTVTLTGDHLVLGSSDGSVYFIQKESGKLIWKFKLDGGTPTSAIITENYVIFGSSYQFLYVIARKDGRLLDRWNAGYGSGFSGGLAYDTESHLLYALSGAANLYSFKIK